MGTIALTGVAVFAMFVPVAVTYNVVLALTSHRGSAALAGAVVFAVELLAARRLAVWLRRTSPASAESVRAEAPSISEINERLRRRQQ